MIQKSNERENSKHIDHNFKKGNWATLVQPGAVERTLAIKHRGPYKVLKQHKNGSITIQVAPYKIKKCKQTQTYAVLQTNRWQSYK